MGRILTHSLVGDLKNMFLGKKQDNCSMDVRLRAGTSYVMIKNVYTFCSCFMMHPETYS